MRPEFPTFSGGIGNTDEWRLIYWLRENTHHFAPERTQTILGSRRSRKSTELYSAIQLLDAQIRQTFTILKLDLLLYLEYEYEATASQMSSDSEDDEGSSQTCSDPDSDDYTNETSPPNFSSQSAHLLEIRSASLKLPDSPSPKKALSLLKSLCSLLEARVNSSLVPLQPEDSDQSTRYPKLLQLKEYVSRSSTSSKALQFIPCYGCDSGQFLFNIAEDAATAKAFVDFAGPGQERPRGETRKKMLENANGLTEWFSMFNRFVSKLQLSSASLGKLELQPTAESTMRSSTPMVTQLHRFRQQVTTAYQAILSQVRSCDHTTPENHQILLQLPGKEHIVSDDPADTEGDRPVQIFFNLCSSMDWQLAKMSFLLPEHKDYKPSKLCKALHYSHKNNFDLEFYVPGDLSNYDSNDIPIKIPDLWIRKRRHTTKCPNKDNLRTLIMEHRFDDRVTMSMLHNTRHKGGTVIGMEQRKALAIKIVLGLMVSMDSDFQASNPQNIYVLDPMDDEYVPFVSVPGKLDSELREKGLLLSNLNLDENEDNMNPVPQFTSLAITLLQILLGEHPPLTSWQDLQCTISRLAELRLCSKAEVDRNAVPFLQASLSCLDFHLNYQSRVRQAKSKEKIDIAWEVVFDTILAKIDDKIHRKFSAKELPFRTSSQSVIRERLGTSFVMAPGNHSHAAVNDVQKKARIDGAGPLSPNQPNVKLFDTKDTSGPTTAKEFWALLEKFHESYSHYVSDRRVKNGGELPRRVRVAILDTGIDFKHPEIIYARQNGRVRKEWCQNWVDDEADMGDGDDGLHGTNCVALLHKSAPEADIYIAKVFGKNSVNFREAENIAKAIKHAEEIWDVDIISMSFGLRRPEAQVVRNTAQERSDLDRYRIIEDDIRSAIRKATNKPCIIFAAAANEGKNKPRAFPASCSPWVFCVHASHGNGEDGGINPAADGDFQFMTLGMGIELIEREWVKKSGVEYPKWKAVLKSGTSFATPIAAGIAATVLDLSERVEAIDRRVSWKLRSFDNFQKVLQLMAKQHVSGGLYYMAPWLHWETNWQTDPFKVRSSWDKINEMF